MNYWRNKRVFLDGCRTWEREGTGSTMIRQPSTKKVMISINLAWFGGAYVNHFQTIKFEGPSPTQPC